jgi:hypothetical protein
MESKPISIPDSSPPEPDYNRLFPPPRTRSVIPFPIWKKKPDKVRRKSLLRPTDTDYKVVTHEQYLSNYGGVPVKARRFWGPPQLDAEVVPAPAPQLEKHNIFVNNLRKPAARGIQGFVPPTLTLSMAIDMNDEDFETFINIKKDGCIKCFKTIEDVKENKNIIDKLKQVWVAVQSLMFDNVLNDRIIEEYKMGKTPPDTLEDNPLNNLMYGSMSVYYQLLEEQFEQLHGTKLSNLFSEDDIEVKKVVEIMHNYNVELIKKKIRERNPFGTLTQAARRLEGEKGHPSRGEVSDYITYTNMADNIKNIKLGADSHLRGGRGVGLGSYRKYKTRKYKTRKYKTRRNKNRRHKTRIHKSKKH